MQKDDDITQLLDQELDDEIKDYKKSQNKKKHRFMKNKKQIGTQTEFVVDQIESVSAKTNQDHYDQEQEKNKVQENETQQVENITLQPQGVEVNDVDNAQKHQENEEENNSSQQDLNHLSEDQKQHELFKKTWSEYSIANMTAQMMIEKIKPQIMKSLHLNEMPQLQGKKIKERNFQDQQEVQLEIQMGNSVLTANVVDPYTEPTVISAQYITNVSQQKYEEPSKLEESVQQLIDKQVKQKVEDELHKKFQKFNVIMFRTGQAKADNHQKKQVKNHTIYDAIIDSDFGQKLEVQFDIQYLNGQASIELKSVSTPDVSLVETFKPSELGENWNEPLKVKQISTYAKEQIKEFKDNAHLLKGQLLQPFYLANGMIFDDDPTIMEQMVEPDWTQSNTAYHNNSEEYHALWDHKDQSENGFHPVKYKSQETMYDPEDIILNYDTGITLKTDSSQITNDDSTNVPNPIKSRSYQTVTNREVLPNPVKTKSKKNQRFQKKKKNSLKNVAKNLDNFLLRLRKRR